MCLSVLDSTKDKREMSTKYLGKKYLTAQEICEMFQIKISKLYRMTSQGLIAHIKIGNALRFDPEEVMKDFKVDNNRGVLA